MAGMNIPSSCPRESTGMAHVPYVIDII